MRRLSRKAFGASFAAAAATAGVGIRAGSAAEFSYRLGTELPASHPCVVHLLRAAQRINQESNGRMEIRIFPSASLGSGPQVLSQVRLGALEFSSTGDNYLGDVVTAAGISTVPLAFTSLQNAVGVMDGPLGTNARRALEKAGIYAFAKVFPLGLRQTANSLRPINTPADFKGLKIRTPNDPNEVATFKAFGASVNPTIGAAEMYVSLQTHLVDGIDLPMASIEAYKIYEVQKYVSFTNHGYLGFTIVANGDIWQKTPADLRTIVDRAVTDAANAYRRDFIGFDASLEKVLRDKGMILNHPTAGIEVFRSVVRQAGLYAQLRETYGAETWGILEKSVGKLA